MTLLTFMITFCHALVSRFKMKILLLLGSPLIPPKKETSLADTMAQEW